MMGIYQRQTTVNAIQFFEAEYLANKQKYPFVFDRAMFSELWFDKNVADGRYYVSNQNAVGVDMEYTTVNEGDYIVREEYGIIFCIPAVVFEKNYKLLDQDNPSNISKNATADCTFIIKKNLTHTDLNFSTGGDLIQNGEKFKIITITSVKVSKGEAEVICTGDYS